MCPFSECCSLRTGNINITLSHNHSAFARCSPYILREPCCGSAICWWIMNVGFQGYLLIALKHHTVVLEWRTGGLKCQSENWVEFWLIPVKKTHTNDNNNAFRYGYYEANTMWSMVKAQHWTTVHITHNKSVLVHVGTLMSNYCPSTVHTRGNLWGK